MYKTNSLLEFRSSKGKTRTLIESLCCSSGMSRPYISISREYLKLELISNI